MKTHNVVRHHLFYSMISIHRPFDPYNENGENSHFQQLILLQQSQGKDFTSFYIHKFLLKDQLKFFNHVSTAIL